MYYIAYIHGMMFAMSNIDANLSLFRLGTELRRRRLARGLTQAQLAGLARLSRAVVIRAEQGDPTIAIGNIARLLGATGAELHVDALRLPTLEEAQTLFRDE